MAEKPGTRFEYSNCVTFLLSAIIQKATKQKTFDFMQQYLLVPLGIADVKWAATPDGINVGYGRMWLTPHDMAKIGWLYLNNGRWGSQQIISENWVKNSIQKHITATTYDGYGYQWWVSPDKFYVAIGYRGQFIYVVLKKNMVILFTSRLEKSDFFIPEKLLNKYIIPAAVSDSPLPENSKQAIRIDSLVNEGAVPRSYVWKTEEEGKGIDGLFTRTAVPAFQLAYPTGCTKLDLNPLHDNERTVESVEMAKRQIRMVINRYQNIQITIYDMIAEGDMVAARSTFQGILRQNGNKMTIPGISITRFKDGKIVEVWRTFDTANIFRQLGISLPPNS